MEVITPLNHLIRCANKANNYNNFKLNTMQKGTVKFFNETKGFGFIKNHETGEDLFVHVTGLIDDIRDNDEVKFETEEGRKGLNAVNVELVD